VEKGLVADLSVFKNDATYKSFNSSIMNMMNYYGMQAGLPQFIQPWGVFVNKELAEQNNIDVPDPDWSIDDYTLFISQGNKETFWGAMDIPLSWINTGTKDINYSLSNHKDGDYVNLNSDAVKSMLDKVPTWADNTIWTQMMWEAFLQRLWMMVGGGATTSSPEDTFLPTTVIPG
jgi:maltose-binding protein MalE